MKKEFISFLKRKDYFEKYKNHISHRGNNFMVGFLEKHHQKTT